MTLTSPQNFDRLLILFSARFFLWARSFNLWRSFSFAFFASLQFDWATTTGRLLGLATFSPDKDGGIHIKVLPKETSKLAGFSKPFLLC